MAAKGIPVELISLRSLTRVPFLIPGSVCQSLSPSSICRYFLKLFAPVSPAAEEFFFEVVCFL